jgi:hypothetical protein
LTSAVDEGEWSASRPDGFTLEKIDPRYPLDKRLVGAQSRSGCYGEDKFFCPCRESNLGHPAHSPSLYRLSCLDPSTQNSLGNCSRRQMWSVPTSVYFRSYSRTYHLLEVVCYSSNSIDRYSLGWWRTFLRVRLISALWQHQDRFNPRSLAVMVLLLLLLLFGKVRFP